MTKEEFIATALDMCIYGGDSVVAKELFDELFESNVVIPKGENRHPYADVLHEWIEDVSKTLESHEYSHDNGKYYWADCDIKYAVRTLTTEIRIKPSEPVYEWQFEFIDKECKIVTFFMTDEELIQKRESGKIPKKVYIKKPETKQERKQ